LANALAFVAIEYKVPIIAELTATENPALTIAAGKETARELLNSLVAKTSHYEWREQKGVVHFYQKTLLNAAGDPLNLRLRSFQLPENVSQLKILLPARLHSAAEGIQEGGGALSAFPSAALEKQTLPPSTFKDATGRDILLAAAALQPQFSSIIILPHAYPQDKKDLQYASAHWFWFSLTGGDYPLIQ